MFYTHECTSYLCRLIPHSVKIGQRRKRADLVFSVVPMVSFWLRGGAWFHRPRLATSFQIGVSSLRSRVCSIQHTLAVGPNLNPNRADPLGLTFGSALAHPALSRPPASRFPQHQPRPQPHPCGLARGTVPVFGLCEPLHHAGGP